MNPRTRARRFLLKATAASAAVAAVACTSGNETGGVFTLIPVDASSEEPDASDEDADAGVPFAGVVIPPADAAPPNAFDASGVLGLVDAQPFDAEPPFTGSVDSGPFGGGDGSASDADASDAGDGSAG